MLLSKASIKTRLLSLAGLSVASLAALFAANRMAEKKVADAYRSMDAAQQAVQSAHQAIEAADRLKDNVNLIRHQVMKLRMVEKTFLQFRAAEFKSDFDDAADTLNHELARLKFDGISADFREYRKTFEQRAAVQTEHDALVIQMSKPLKLSENRLSAIQSDLEAKQAAKQMEGTTLAADEMELMNVARDCKIAFLKLQNINQLFQTTGDQKYVQDYKEVAGNEAAASSRSLREFANALNNTNYQESSRLIIGSLDEFERHVEKSLALVANGNLLEQRLDERGEAILHATSAQLADASQDVLREEVRERTANEQMQQARTVAASARKTANFVMAMTIVAVLIVYLVICAGIIHSINISLKSTISGVTHITEQAAAAAQQVTTASQLLAEGATQQAASIVQTGASLSQMSSMTRRNAENAQKANDLAKQTRAAADKGAGDMQTMNTAMEAIKVSSDDIAKIIKTIDEIAFQTNILALNAAVEAARAGDAGLGFAVVAEEVRGLAQRSAHAAKETAAKIQGAIVKSGQGVEICNKVAHALAEIVAKAHEMNELAAEVASASREQTEGIAQVNVAVSNVDKVTQTNAASAQESAAAAAELNAQAAAMKTAMIELQKLAGHHSEKTMDPGHLSCGATMAPKPQAGKRPSSAPVRRPASRPAPASIAPREIPRGDDFADF